MSVDTADPYLDHILSLSLDDILREPDLITVEAATVDAELVNLCYREYPTFLSVHQCSTAVDSAFDDLFGSLTALLDSAPALETECKGFSPVAETRHRERVSTVQEHQNRIIELLELPQLVETCIRNGFYNEALELSQHPALALDNPLARDVSREVDDMLQTMITQLVGLLREPVKLATSVRAINFLKRLEVDELGLIFLHSRLHNYRSAVQQLDTEPVRYLRRYIDLFREHVYDIVSQYTTIFEPTYTPFVGLVDDLLDVVAVYIAKIDDTAALSSVLVQLGYCAMSFARVGLDFGLLAGTVFTDVVLSSYTRAVDLATADFKGHKRVPVFYNAHIDALNSLRLLAPITLQVRVLRLLDASIETATAIVTTHINNTLKPETSETPRAHLLRRSTETLLSPEALQSKNDEMRKRCEEMEKQWKEMAPRLKEHAETVFVH